MLEQIMRATMNPEIVSREIEKGIVEFVLNAKAKGAVLGLSGGVDSTLTAYLTKSAFDRYNAENPDKEQLKLFGYILPSSANQSADERDGRKVAEMLGIEYKVIPIQPWVDLSVEKIPEALDEGLHTGNLSSEIRAVVLSRYTAKRGCIMLNTGNRDEDHGIGYCSKRGDNLGDLAPIANIPKRLVRQLALHKGAPSDIAYREPTAGLQNGQTDEKDLGYASAHRGIEKLRNLGTYDYIEIVTNGLDQGLSSDRIQEITGFEPDVIKDIKFRHEVIAPHKGQVAPPGIQVTLDYVPLDWRMYENE